MFMHNQKLLQFLMRLNDSYEQARSQILMMVPLPTLNKAYSLLIERERQCSMTQTSSSNSSELNGVFSTGLNSKPSTAKPRPHFSSSYDPNAICDYCNRTCHTKAICYQLHGYLPGYERRKRGSPNTYQGRGRSNNDRRTYHAAHTAISKSDQFNYSRVWIKGIKVMVESPNNMIKLIIIKA